MWINHVLLCYCDFFREEMLYFIFRLIRRKFHYVKPCIIIIFWYILQYECLWKLVGPLNKKNKRANCNFFFPPSREEKSELWDINSQLHGKVTIAFFARCKLRIVRKKNEYSDFFLRIASFAIHNCEKKSHNYLFQPCYNTNVII